MLSCKLPGDSQNSNNELKSSDNGAVGIESIASEFLAFKLDELVEQPSQKELETVILDGESDNWQRTQFDQKAGEVTIQNKIAKDNVVKFKLYGQSSSIAMIALQQQNAQVTVTELWEYHFNVNGDHPERWNQYLLPDYKLDSFFDERIALPKEFQGTPAKPYLDFELGTTSVVVNLNKWTYMRELESNSYQADGALDPALIKYKYVYRWHDGAMHEEQVKEAGYSEELLFPSHVVESTDGGPGPHEFDCGHGVSVKASSVLPKQGAHSYSAANVTDGSDATAWSEGVEGYGEGEWIEFTLTSDFRIGDSWQIGNGYNRDKEVWQQNSRVKKLKVLVDDKVLGYVMLSNLAAYQSFNISPSWLKEAPSFRKGTRIRFVIEQVYQGSRYDDTLISYFVPVGNCG
jgi:hypothetical protein